MSSTVLSERTEMLEALGRLLSQRVTGLERIGGGRNSQVYKVAAESADDSLRHFALKVYFRHTADNRDRLGTEYNSFSYLWSHGFREVPQPVAADPSLGWAVYQFIEGEKILPDEANERQVLAAADFLGRLRELSQNPESRKLGMASEAFFAVGLIVENLRQRFERLRGAEGDTTAYQALRQFLDREFGPLLERVIHWCDAHLKTAGMTFGEELNWNQRTLSPSDFGFHNALRQQDGRIIFLDFEYFGWDDPAKMIADFLLHPAMEVSTELKQKFASAIFQRFSDWPDLRTRVESVYPLFGLKWCLILLNEFLSDSFQRRQFAATATADRSTLQMQQLDKARRMLNRISQEYQSFPYRA